MPTTSNFGWTTPADTDLVKDGAAAIRTLGNGIDASFLDLKGGTTNQVLAKNSNTDLDFKWVADATGIPATIFDAKGDLIVATAADTADRLASSGVNGNVLTVDTTTATGLKWSAPSTGALTLITSATASNTSSTLAIDNAFSSTYDNYLVLANLKSAAESGVTIKFRASGSDTSQQYNYAGYLIDSDNAVIYAAIGNNTTGISAGDTNTQYGFMRLFVGYPNKAERTSYELMAIEQVGTNNKASIQTYAGTQSQTTQFTGISFTTGGSNLTGVVRIYGYANS